MQLDLFGEADLAAPATKRCPVFADPDATPTLRKVPISLSAHESDWKLSSHSWLCASEND